MRGVKIPLGENRISRFRVGIEAQAARRTSGFTLSSRRSIIVTPLRNFAFENRQQKKIR